MKLSGFFFALILFLSFITPKAYSQSKFEGKVVIETSGIDGSGTLNYYIKGQNIRLDMNSARGEVNALFDRANKKVLMIMPAMKMYMEFPMDLMKDNSENENMDNETDKFEKTGEMKKINGYNCEKWIMKENNGSTEAWMTKDLGGFMFFDSPMGNKSESTWQKDIEESGNFPMLVIQKNNEGDEISKFNVLTVVSMNLDDSFFKVPDGYSQMKMPIGGQK
jgi:hypothetical protein